MRMNEIYSAISAINALVLNHSFSDANYGIGIIRGHLEARAEQTRLDAELLGDDDARAGPAQLELPDDDEDLL